MNSNTVNEDAKKVIDNAREDLENNINSIMQELWTQWTHLGIDQETKENNLLKMVEIEKELHGKIISETIQKLENMQNRFYTRNHEWVLVTDSIGTIGTSSFAKDALGEVLVAQLPDVGRQLQAGDQCGTLKGVKTAGEVYVPVSGTVTEKNTAVESTPSLINKACYTKGWLFRVKLASPDDLHKLMDRATYDKYLEESH